MSCVPYALIVEDDFFTTMKASAIFTDFGFRPLDVPNADQALTLLRAQGESITLLFTDVRMAGSMDGLALARKVAEEWPNIAIVVVSGQSRPAPADLPKKATFLFKPFNADTLAAHLNDILPDGKKPEPLKKAV